MRNINNHNNTNQEKLILFNATNIPNTSKPLYVYVDCEFRTIEGEVLSFENVIIDRRYRLQPSKFPNLEKQLGIANIEGKFVNIVWGNHLTSGEFISQEQSKILTSVVNIESNSNFH